MNSHLRQRQENERLKTIIARIDSYEPVVSFVYFLVSRPMRRSHVTFLRAAVCLLFTVSTNETTSCDTSLCSCLFTFYCLNQWEEVTWLFSFYCLNQWEDVMWHFSVQLFVYFLLYQLMRRSHVTFVCAAQLFVFCLLFQPMKRSHVFDYVLFYQPMRSSRVTFLNAAICLLSIASTNEKKSRDWNSW